MRQRTKRHFAGRSGGAGAAIDALVRPVERSDAGAWLTMRRELWPEASVGEHEREIAAFFRGRAAEPLAVLIAERSDGEPLGFAELSIRPFADGCRSSPVAYLEGWYVVPKARRRGVGRRLVRASEAWARRRRCRELASDTEIANRISAAAHRAIGFEDAGTIRCFRKDV
jgi:aminoglycoside 6'-N-acetyltransferase I